MMTTFFDTMLYQYWSTVWRDITPTEYSYWAGLAEQKGADYVLRAVEDSPEAQTITQVKMPVIALYQGLLGRQPDQDGYELFTRLLSDKSITVMQLAEIIVQSAEFQGRNPGFGTTASNEQILTLLYENLLHREPDAAGIQFFSNALREGQIDLPQIISGFMFSDEFRDEYGYAVRLYFQDMEDGNLEFSSSFGPLSDNPVPIRPEPDHPGGYSGNLAPVAPPISYSVLAGQGSVTITIADLIQGGVRDFEGDPLTFTLQKAAGDGVLNPLRPGVWVYTPADGEAIGDVELAYTVSDGRQTVGEHVSFSLAETPPSSLGGTYSIAAGLASVDFENAGNPTVLSFDVTRAGNTTQSLILNYTISADDVDATDFITPMTGTVTIAAGQTDATLRLQVSGDHVAEPDETFTVTLSENTVYWTPEVDAAEGTIRDDDAQQIGTVSIKALQPGMYAGYESKGEEGDSGTSYLYLLLTRTNASQAITFDYELSGDINADDVVRMDGQTTMAAGDLTGLLTVIVRGDAIVEADEQFTVTLKNAPVGWTIDPAYASATGTILNDDPMTITGMSSDLL